MLSSGKSNQIIIDWQLIYSEEILEFSGLWGFSIFTGLAQTLENQCSGDFD